MACDKEVWKKIVWEEEDMNYQKFIDLIDSYIEEPNNINDEWAECLIVCRRLLEKEQRKEDEGK